MTLLRASAPLRTVLGFALFCALGFGLLWVKAGGHVPVVAAGEPYEASFVTDDLKNLLNSGDVKIAGIKVGTVTSTEEHGTGAKVTFAIDEDVAPLHEGATVRIGVKSLVGTSYVDIVDGSGKELPEGTEFSGKSVIQAVDVDELLDTLDAPTRKSLSHALRSLEVATDGTHDSLDQIMTGVGDFGESGGAVLEAVAKQSEDLTELSAEAGELIAQLDAGQGQIVDVVNDAQRLTEATASRQATLEATVRKLPGVLDSVRAGAVSLDQLSEPLGPITADLKAAAPFLTQALEDLPAVTRDLTALLPDLEGVLDKAPATLTRVPAFDDTLNGLVPTAQTTLADVNPMLTYVAPYGHDLGVLFGNFGGSFDVRAPDGVMPIRLTLTAEGVGTVKGIPFKLPKNDFGWVNGYPAPGTVDQPQHYTDTYPRLKRAE